MALVLSCCELVALGYVDQTVRGTISAQMERPCNTEFEVQPRELLMAGGLVSYMDEILVVVDGLIGRATMS